METITKAYFEPSCLHWGVRFSSPPPPPNFNVGPVKFLHATVVSGNLRYFFLTPGGPVTSMLPRNFPPTTDTTLKLGEQGGDQMPSRSA